MDMQVSVPMMLSTGVFGALLMQSAKFGVMSLMIAGQRFVSSDAASPVDVANVVMFKKVKSICHGTLGVAQRAVRGDLPESSAIGMQEQQAHHFDVATKLAITMQHLIEVFCCEGRNDAFGELVSSRKQILERIKHQIL